MQRRKEETRMLKTLSKQLSRRRMRELSSDTGSRLKKLEHQAFQDKEEMRQMKINYDREIAKITREKIRRELKLSARMQGSEEYHSTGTGANNTQMPDLNSNPIGRNSEEPTKVTQLQVTLDEDEADEAEVDNTLEINLDEEEEFSEALTQPSPVVQNLQKPARCAATAVRMITSQLGISSRTAARQPCVPGRSCSPGAK